MLQYLKKIWHDPVWSKVISTVIIASAGTTLYFLINIFKNIIDFFQKYFDESSIPWFISAFIFLAFLVQLKRKRKIPIPISNTNTNQINNPLQWVQNFSLEEHARYLFLLWFPVNHTLRSQSYRKPGYRSIESISFEHIPEIRDCIDKKVLKYFHQNKMEFGLEVDRDVYEYFDGLYLRDSKKLADELKLIISNFQTRSFEQLFPNSKSF